MASIEPSRGGGNISLSRDYEVIDKNQVIELRKVEYSKNSSGNYTIHAKITVYDRDGNKEFCKVTHTDIPTKSIDAILSEDEKKLPEDEKIKLYAERKIDKDPVIRGMIQIFRDKRAIGSNVQSVTYDLKTREIHVIKSGGDKKLYASGGDFQQKLDSRLHRNQTKKFILTAIKSKSGSAFDQIKNDETKDKILKGETLTKNELDEIEKDLLNEHSVPSLFKKDLMATELDKEIKRLEEKIKAREKETAIKVQNFALHRSDTLKAVNLDHRTPLDSVKKGLKGAMEGIGNLAQQIPNPFKQDNPTSSSSSPEKDAKGEIKRRKLSPPSPSPSPSPSSSSSSSIAPPDTTESDSVQDRLFSDMEESFTPRDFDEDASVTEDGSRSQNEGSDSLSEFRASDDPLFP